MVLIHIARAGQILGREWSYLVYGPDHFESQQATKDGWDAVTPERLRALYAQHLDELEGQAPPSPLAPEATPAPVVMHCR